MGAASATLEPWLLNRKDRHAGTPPTVSPGAFPPDEDIYFCHVQTRMARVFFAEDGSFQRCSA